jgi:transposase
MTDKVQRGRCFVGNHAGERNARARLKAADIPKIVASLRAGATLKSIAKRYPVGHSLIGRISTGKAWVAQAAAAGWPPAVARLGANTAATPHERASKCR